MKALINKFFNNEDGATAIEYGLIAALIAVAIITAVRAVGSSLGTTFSEVASNL
ncbi:MAG: Flp family type IVb pilin [Pseudomonadota bacterium]